MQPAFDSNGEKEARDYLIFDGEEPVSIYEISHIDAETLKSIISKVELNAAVDSELYSIMLEEADYLFMIIER